MSSELLRAYVEAQLGPLLDDQDRAALIVSIEGGPEEPGVLVQVPSRLMRFILGSRGLTIGAVRTLARARGRCLKLPGALDVRVSSL
jgi:hypothetical protein